MSPNVKDGHCQEIHLRLYWMHIWGTSRGETLTEQLLKISLLNDLAATWLDHLYLVILFHRWLFVIYRQSAICQQQYRRCSASVSVQVVMSHLTAVSVSKQLTMASTVCRIQDTGTGHQAIWPLRSAPLAPGSCVHGMLLLVACIYCFPSVLLSAAPGSEWSCTLGEISSCGLFSRHLQLPPLSTVQWLSGHSLDIIYTGVDVNTDAETQILTPILQRTVPLLWQIVSSNAAWRWE